MTVPWYIKWYRNRRAARRESRMVDGDRGADRGLTSAAGASASGPTGTMSDVGGAVPDAAEVVLRSLLERNAAARPDRRVVSFEDAQAWTNAEALAQAYTAGNALRALGVSR